MKLAYGKEVSWINNAILSSTNNWIKSKISIQYPDEIKQTGSSNIEKDRTETE